METTEDRPAPGPGGPTAASDRAAQAVLLAATGLLGWLLMQVLHEAGHVLTAWATGGEVERVVLHPLAFSRTLLMKNPSPLAVAWGGAVGGCALPLLGVALVRAVAPARTSLARAIAGLCLVANGVYLGVGAFLQGADAGDLLADGAARWQLVLFGVVASGCGLATWHGIGPAFGLGPAARRIDRREPVAVAALLVLVVVLEVSLSPRG
jgi:hypothetical protein